MLWPFAGTWAVAESAEKVRNEFNFIAALFDNNNLNAVGEKERNRTLLFCFFFLINYIRAWKLRHSEWTLNEAVIGFEKLVNANNILDDAWVENNTIYLFGEKKPLA